MINITVLTTIQDCPYVNEQLTSIIESKKLPLNSSLQTLEKLNNKSLKQVASEVGSLFLTAERDKKSNLVCDLCTVTNDEKNKPIITKVSPDWHKLQRRIVTAGRKTELLLQACKLSEGSKVLDATAGFGHDSLILASTLSNEHGNVTMMEQNPIMALLLMLEHKRMCNEKNWQGLMGRLQVRFGNVMEAQLDKYDVVYLDPMFPNDSYEGAKVGKGMQVLHNLAKPPTLEEESQLLIMAKNLLDDGGRVVVKRPKNAPFIAKSEPKESWSNDVLRFDGYF